MSGTIEPALLAAFKGKIMAAAAVHPYMSLAVAAGIPLVAGVIGYGALLNRVDTMEARAAEDRAAMVEAFRNISGIREDLQVIRVNQEWYNRSIGAGLDHGQEIPSTTPSR